MTAPLIEKKNGSSIIPLMLRSNLFQRPLGYTSPTDAFGRQCRYHSV